MARGQPKTPKPTKKRAAKSAHKVGSAAADVDRSADVDRWVRRRPAAQRRVIEGLRKLIRDVAPELHEAIKWSQPVWSGHAPVCYVLARSGGHVTFGFWNGTSLEDPEGRLEGTGARMRHVKLEHLGDVPAAQLRSFVRQASRFDRAAGESDRAAGDGPRARTTGRRASR